MTLTWLEAFINRRHLPTLTAWAAAHPGTPMPVAELERIAHGAADRTDAADRGQAWVTALVETARACHLGQLERDAGGAVAFRFGVLLPDWEDEWERLSDVLAAEQGLDAVDVFDDGEGDAGWETTTSNC